MISEGQKFIVAGVVALLVLLVYVHSADQTPFPSNDNQSAFKPNITINPDSVPTERTDVESSTTVNDSGLTKYECFVCQEGKPSSGNVISNLFGQPSLAGGSCSFSIYTETDLLKELFKNKGLGQQSYITNFMIGQGPNFLAYDAANQYCDSNLGMAVKWSTNTKDGSPPPPADAGAAGCFLSQDVFPIYVYYSGGRYLDSDSMKKFVAPLKDKGPVIVTTEAEYTDSEFVDVKNQVLAINNACPNCLIALFPKDLAPDFEKTGNMNPLDAVLSDSAVYSKIAFVAQGTIANRFDLCTAEEAPVRMMNLSSNILKKWGIPTIYVYYGAYVGNNSNGTCSFDSDLVARNLDYVGANIPALENSGILGIAYVSFNDYSPDPMVPKLPPTLSDQEAQAVGLTDSGGTQKTPYFNKWFSNCRDYYNNSKKSKQENATGNEIYNLDPLCYSSTGSPAGLQFESVLNSYSVYKNYGQTTPDDIQQQAGTQLKFSCAACLGAPGLFIGNESVNSLQDQVKGSQDKLCNYYDSEIQASSSKCDLDPIFVRAIAWQESNFDQCAVSSGGSGTVNPTDYNSACSKSPYNGPHGGACAMGLMQCTDAPNYGSGQGAGCQGSTGTRALSCAIGGKYNPFDAGQSICCGTNFLCTLTDQIGRFVDDHQSDFDSSVINDPNSKKWLIYWLSAVAYNYGTGNMIKAFDMWVAQKDDDANTVCDGNNNIADYICNCPAVGAAVPGGDQAYACKVAAKYQALQNVCNSGICAHSGSTGSYVDIGPTNICVVDQALQQVSCPYLGGGETNGPGDFPGVACTGYNGAGDDRGYQNNNACDPQITGNRNGVSVNPSANNGGQFSTLCVTGVCKDGGARYYDCSGLINYAYTKCGIPNDIIQRTANHECDNANVFYSAADYPDADSLAKVLQPGDLLQVDPATDDSAKHIAMFVGNVSGTSLAENGVPTVIDAPNTCGRVAHYTLADYLTSHQLIQACRYSDSRVVNGPSGSSGSGS